MRAKHTRFHAWAGRLPTGGARCVRPGSKLRLCTQARVVGVAFFDFKHGQTGVAPNAIELHPILDFACLVGPGGEPNA